MHLEKNLNRSYRVLYVVTGIVLVLLPLVAHALFAGWLTVALILCGVLSIASGAYGH